MRIDFHTHAHPDSIADGAMKAAEHFLRLKSLWSMTIAGLHKQMNSSQVDKCVVLCITDSPANLRETNDWAIDIQGDRIIPFGTLLPDYQDCAQEVRRLRTAGLKGIKLHCGANRFRPDDERLYPAYEEMSDDMVVLIHAGALQFSSDDPVSGAPHRIARVLKEFPKLKIIAAHFGGYLMLDKAWEHLIGKDLYIDTTWPPSLWTIGNPGEIAKIIKSHGPDKILFGTDCPFNSQADEINYIMDLPIDREHKHMILGENARNLLDL